MIVTATVFPVTGQEGVDGESGARGQRSERGRRLLDDAEPAPVDSQLTGSENGLERRKGEVVS